MRRTFSALIASLALAACSTSPLPEDVPAGGRIAAEGSQVAIGQSVRVGPAILTPLRVTEDSRCPINARCVWAGEAKVDTRIETATGRQVVELTLGEPHATAAGTFALVTVEPGQRASVPEIPPEAYRFVFEYR